MWLHITALLYLLRAVLARCYDPSPAFPLPLWSNGANDLAPAFSAIEKKLDDLLSDSAYDVSSFSVAVTSNTDTLWSHFHSAKTPNKDRGVTEVDGDSLYRIASISKTFTVLGLLHQVAEGTLELDTPVKEYIPEFQHSDSGDLPWKDITLRALASQLSGIPREFLAIDDVALAFPDPTKIGLPPVTDKDKTQFPSCDTKGEDDLPICTRKQLIEWVKNHGKPVFAPNQQSTYSNLAFEILGLVIEEATNMTYKDYMKKSIFDPLEMSLSSIDTPSEKHAVIPAKGWNYWGVDEGVQSPTGGIYSSSNDMSKYLRYILTHFNAIATGVNWLMPASWGEGAYNFYGMPWEIFRPHNVLKESRRPVTFVTKSGGVPGYQSRISILPEHGLGITILLSCGWDCGNLLEDMQEAITVDLVRTAENVIWKDVSKTYAGHYVETDSKLNSSIVLEASPSKGLVATEFISNGTDVLNTVVPRYFVDNSRKWKLQAVPTLLYKDEKEQQGEIFRFTAPYVREKGLERGIWDEFCVTDIDAQMFVGLPLSELVFWHEDDTIELPAWKVTMKRMKESPQATEPLIVQG